MSERAKSEIRLMAVASVGGHWEQLMLLQPALEGYSVEYVTTDPDLAKRDGITRVTIIPDSNRNRPFVAAMGMWQAVRIVFKSRPHVIITTGALPGLLCIVAGRLIGVKTLWIDSVANSEHVSASGRWARWLSSRAITQWEHLAAPSGLIFDGRLL